MKNMIRFLSAITFLLAASSQAAFDHSLFDSVLKKHVKHGMVDYAALSDEPKLDKYLEKLANADLETLETENDKMAFYINAYNAYTLQLVASAYPTTSIRLIDGVGSTTDATDKASPWKIEFAEIAGKTYSLDYIEHEILRKDFDDARIHYAIVCAAISCPILRSEAFVGDLLDEQLDSQGRWFFTWRNDFDPENKVARLSKILEWFQVDFGGSEEAVLKAALPYLKPKVAQALKGNESEWKVVYASYDWTLNSQETEK